MAKKKTPQPKQISPSHSPRAIESNEYLTSIKERAGNKRIGYKHQLIGLEVADILDDRSHKALYIKLVKKFGEQKILTLAKSVAERKNIKNKGAYFMSMLHIKNDS